MAKLKLIINKGPRSGETREFNSTTPVQLGRVERGNNLTIKEPGISSKHLTIEFNSDSSKWFITDLDSSNGTILNSSELKPLSPFEINDGDVIKIGEITSIRVSIGEISDELDNRRYPTRQGTANKVVVLEESNSGNVKGGVGVGCGVGIRRAQSSRKVEELVAPVKRTRRAKNVDEAVLRKVMEENVVGIGDYGEVHNVGVVEGKKTKGGRVGRKKVVVKDELKGNLSTMEESVIVNGNMLKMGIPENGGGSHVGKRFSDRMESDLAVEDQVMRACELDTSYDGRVTGQESVQVPSLEKMAVGEWFDYLEVYLPKQIYTVTDEIIDDMRKSAKQFAEFMLQQQKEKGMLPDGLLSVFHTFEVH